MDTQPSARVPLAVLMDYDSTICLTAISDEIMKEDSIRPGWKEIDDAYVAGRLGSRENLELFMPLLPADPAAVLATADRQPHDPAFVPFVERARAAGVALEVVSDGFGFYVGRNLERLGVEGMAIATSRMTWPGGDGPRIEFPFGHPACRVCGTCKRERVRAYQARGCHVAFVGDGFTDRYAAAHADTVIAKDDLVGVCEAAGIDYVPWRSFTDVAAWLEGVLAAPDDLAPPRARPFICGPEAWGPGRTAPPPGSIADRLATGG
ncbi:MAG: haloacid dehalogenase-like hydrolase [Chloroflexi bacterium]|nr:haloacid dehalogenase-like hydrolase [Chloroflexota bacterium]